MILRRLTGTKNNFASSSARDLADSFRDAGAWDQAAKHYAEFLDSHPADVAILVQYGHALKESGKYDEALVAYDRALTLSPNDDDIHLSRGHALKLLGRLGDSRTAYACALEHSPTNVSALHELQALTPRVMSFE